VWIDEGRYGKTDRLFTDDVVVKSPRGEARGIEALTELVRSGHDTYVRTLHSKSNLIIEVDGETATVRAHDIAVYVIDAKTEALAAGFRRYGPLDPEDTAGRELTHHPGASRLTAVRLLLARVPTPGDPGRTRGANDG
jgi:hypothetical protein